jgi:hypothetical protein
MTDPFRALRMYDIYPQRIARPLGDRSKNRRVQSASLSCDNSMEEVS